ncbi:DHA2 family efflux MFS transporter permease subunit [Pendulispora brunnea]|uniref:DHA2 family efflux MFS transporter permease subunit n=1 Tax=Pendulispora brunnea TaxID=2905690 RepID=A0ABZ2KEC1_9BACT
MSATPEEAGGFHPGHNPWGIALTVTLATFMEVLDTSIANVALPHVAGGLSATNEESTWVLTSYLVSNAIVLPISGWLASRIGRKRFYMICVTLFTVSSFLCGMAPSLGMLIFFRVLQGLGGGGLAPSEQSILADTFEPKRRGMAFAVYGMAVVLAPAVGPTLGGYITDNIGWRWIFFINVPVGILSLVLTHRVVRDPPWLAEERSRRRPIDFVGLGLVAIGLGSLEVVLDKGQQEDWFSSSFITFFAMASAVSLVAFVVWELVQKHPVVDLRLFKNRNFAISNLLIFFLGVILFGTTVLLPQFLQTLMGYSAQKAGMTLSPGAMSIILFMPLIGFLVSHVPARWLVAFGFVVTWLALERMSQINLDLDFRTATVWRIYQSAGMAFLFIPINTAAYVGVPKEKNNDVSGMLNLSRNVGGSVGISFITTYIARQSQVHQTYLVGHATPFDEPYRALMDSLVRNKMAEGASLPDATLGAQGQIYSELIRHATVLSYVDVILILAFAAACIVPLTLLLKANPPGHGPAMAH